VLKFIDTVAWIATAFVLAATIYAATSAYSQELITPLPDTHPEITRGISPMCVS
jgi:hypothetical protein